MGDATKAREKLGWTPTQTLDDLVRDMMQADLKLFQREKFLQSGGFEVPAQYE